MLVIELTEALNQIFVGNEMGITNVVTLFAGRKIIAGSCIGGIKETQEMVDFAAKHNVKPDIEVIPIDYVNTAMERLLKADVKYRFVIDIGNTLKPST